MKQRKPEHSSPIRAAGTRAVDCGYEFKLSSIGADTWQLYAAKANDTSDYIRVIYGVTEQVGGGARTFKILRHYILTPVVGHDPVFMLQLGGAAMKNRRVWVVLETVRRQKGKRGMGVGTFIALSPVQSKWRTAMGASTKLEVRPLAYQYFELLYADNSLIDPGFRALLET